MKLATLLLATLPIFAADPTPGASITLPARSIGHAFAVIWRKAERIMHRRVEPAREWRRKPFANVCPTADCQRYVRVMIDRLREYGTVETTDMAVDRSTQ